MNQIKIDNYTKGVLTLIAVCLTILAVKQLDVIPKAYAGDTISNPSKPYVNYGLVPLNEDGSVTVKLAPASIMDVNIEEVGGYSTWGTLKVEIE